MSLPPRQTAIVGIGATEFSKNSGRSELQLAAEAVKRAAGRRVFAYSAETGEGRDVLSRALLKAANISE